MALSMEERRILAQIEDHLSQNDPRLAQRFSKFGSTGPPADRPRRRARVIAAVAVAVIGAATAIVTATITAFS